MLTPPPPVPDLPPDRATWQPRLSRWAVRLQAARLDGLVDALLEALEPLAPLGAQALYVAQPTLGLVMARDEIVALARLLETPGDVDWLRAVLIGAEAVPPGAGTPGASVPDSVADSEGSADAHGL